MWYRMASVWNKEGKDFTCRVFSNQFILHILNVIANSLAILTLVNIRLHFEVQNNQEPVLCSAALHCKFILLVGQALSTLFDLENVLE